VRGSLRRCSISCQPTEFIVKTNQFITASRHYLITSYGNGWAYEVEDRDTGDAFFVQDDAAQTLQTDTNNFENEDTIAEYMAVHGE
jgi:hypothetical protein